VNAKNPETLTEPPAGTPAAPRAVRAAWYGCDAVRITWSDASTNEIGFGVERSLDDGKTWATIACRPPRINGTDPDGLAWIDFSAPPGKPLLYRVAALAGDQSQSSASEPSAALTFDPLRP
jgi:hypothetical protein